MLNECNEEHFILSLANKGNKSIHELNIELFTEMNYKWTSALAKPTGI